LNILHPQAFRQALRNISRPAMNRFQQVRQFSHDEATAVKEMNQMVQGTKIGVAVCGFLFLTNVAIHLSHEHHEDHSPKYDYRRIRNKPMPWDEYKCDLFDMECKRKQRAGEKTF